MRKLDKASVSPIENVEDSGPERNVVALDSDSDLDLTWHPSSSSSVSVWSHLKAFPFLPHQSIDSPLGFPGDHAIQIADRRPPRRTVQVRSSLLPCRLRLCNFF
ncbi:hypothetical protein ZWY2020_045744 [Hordeum vulgare]|nr:hypothetical protein ZWY2020_045744 [Hordeum vulgare]